MSGQNARSLAAPARHDMASSLGPQSTGRREHRRRRRRRSRSEKVIERDPAALRYGRHIAGAAITHAAARNKSEPLSNRVVPNVPMLVFTSWGTWV